MEPAFFAAIFIWVGCWMCFVAACVAGVLVRKDLPFIVWLQPLWFVAVPNLFVASFGEVRFFFWFLSDECGVEFRLRSALMFSSTVAAIVIGIWGLLKPKRSAAP